MGCAILEMFLRPGNISFGGTASGGMAAWLEGLITRLDDLVWGPWMLALLLGSGCYLMIRMDFFPIRNLRFALRCALGIEGERDADRKRSERSRTGRRDSGTSSGKISSGKISSGKISSGKISSGKISSLSSLTTELATTLGIGNIVGVASAMVLGGPGAEAG